MDIRLTSLLLASLCMAASVGATHSPSPIPSPSEAPISSISSPEMSPSESPAMSPDFELLHPGSFNDAPGLYSQLSKNILDINTEIKDGGADPVVSRVCDSTDHPSLCLSTVVPHLQGGHANLESILRVTVESSSGYAKKALGVVKKLASSKETSPAVKSTLRDCKDSYDTAIENFAKTMDAFPTDDLGTMRSVLSATITFIGDCEDGFSRLRYKSPVSKYAETLTDMTSNCLAIVSQMMTSPY